jgi:hypothetical protein
MWVCASFLFILLIGGGEAKQVQTTIQATWPTFPLHAEMRLFPLLLRKLRQCSEFFGKISGDKFWDFFQLLGVIPQESQKTDKLMYDYAVSKAKELLSKAQLSLLKFGLSLHHYSPKIQVQIHPFFGLTLFQMVRQLTGQELAKIPEQATKIQTVRFTAHYCSQLAVFCFYFG